MELEDEDVSARVLLRQLLHAESPRRPVTRSMVQSQNSRTRQSTQQLSTAGFQSPRMALRQKLKERLHESASKSPVQEKRRLSARFSKTRPLTPSSVLQLDDDDDDVTTRGLLRGILQTEPEMSLLVPVQSTKEDTEPGSAESSVYSSQPSVEMTDLELPDLTIASVTTAIRGISRKRPQKNINLSMFVKKLNEGEDRLDEQQPDETGHLSTLSPQSVSLSLNTPYVDPSTEKQGLRRAVKRRVIDVDNFEEGVQNRLVRKMNTDTEQSLTLAHRRSETGPLEKFTLGFTDFTAMDTTDIIMSSTALYSLPVSQSPAANISIAERDAITSMETQRNKAQEVQKEAKDKQGYMELSGPDREKEQEAGMRAQYEEAGQWPRDSVEENIIERDRREGKMEVKFQLHEEKLGVEEVDKESEQAHRNDTVEVQELVQFEAGVSPIWAGAAQDASSSEKEASGGWHTDSEVEVKNQEVEGSPLLSSPHTPWTPSLGPRNLPSRRSWKTAELTGKTEVEEVGIPTNTSREILTEDLQNKYSWSPSRDLEPLEGDVSPVLTPTREDGDLGATEASQGEEGKRESDQDDGFLSEEFSMKTPAFVRQKRNIQTPEPQTTPNFLKTKSKRQFSKAAAAAKRKPQLKQRAPATDKNPALPRSYVMSTFKHFAKTKVSSDIYPVLKEIMDKYFDRLADDLEAYAAHAKRTTIQVEDVELLLRRQGFVTDSMPVTALIERYFPQGYRKLLIPVATSGNKVVPMQRR
ncbi:centromere protein T isoform X2 [Scleropages formosus]|uniref:centromere protein T isoform X2 n=1 Tax=Scleropages formosus TaxID=113540 RepID=UPI000877EFB2|nr:centromere protein T isoform X2 [Scleropages formosus]